MSNYNYIYVPLIALEKKNISKESLMQDSKESQDFLNDIVRQKSPFAQLTNIFLVHNCLVIAVKNKSIITFDKEDYFFQFKKCIKSTPYIDQIKIDNKKREISINSNISPIFYNLLYEFLV